MPFTRISLCLLPDLSRYGRCQLKISLFSDIERGFVRAEMFKYEDLLSSGSEEKLKELGKFHLKGRDYLVEDGDILSFRVGT